jgi:hypothetical protein
MVDLPRQCRRGTRFGAAPKRCYRTEAEALAAVHGHAGLEVYPCRHCGNYHTGHKPKPRKPRRFWTRAAVRRALKGAER